MRGFERYSKSARCDRFLADMNRIAPYGLQILDLVIAHPAEQDFEISTGTIVDAEIINVPSLPKSRDGGRVLSLLRGHATALWRDSAYQGKGEMMHALAPRAGEMTHRRYRCVGPLGSGRAAQEPS